ncbi:MAG TPA: TRAP transporter substrate-binding protein [Alphaproteobacteria bacterium]|nr:TRAP transporter substrate-binding protein [Alphaproteobacteria bacterium]
MKRRAFIKGAATAGVATAAAAASNFPAPAIAQGIKEWKMALTWPANTPGLGLSAQRVAKRIELFTGGKIKIKVYGAGELVPAFQCWDAASAGDIQMYQGAEYYWQGKHKALNFFTTVPYGLTGSEHYAWLNYGGGQELWDEVAAQFNLKGFVGAWTGVQMGGWFRKEVHSLDDLKGLKFRMPGIGGEVLRKVGVAVVNIPGAEVFPALQSGTIDGTEWVGPWLDMNFGFYKVAKFYYWPGWHEPGTTGEVMINKKVWDGLTKDEQEIITGVIQAEGQYQTSEFRARDVGALRTLTTDHGVKLRRFSNEMLTQFGNYSGEVAAAMAKSDPLTQKVYDSYAKFRKDTIALSKIQEAGYLKARELPFKWG